jgi:hypothetical protein
MRLGISTAPDARQRVTGAPPWHCGSPVSPLAAPQEMAPELADRLDHELGCAFAAVESSRVAEAEEEEGALTPELTRQMQQLNAIGRRHGYRARRRDRERTARRQQPPPPGGEDVPRLAARAELLALFPSLGAPRLFLLLLVVAGSARSHGGSRAV